MSDVKFVFGIDLGTTYSCISYVDESGRTVVLNNSEGSNVTPSVVNFASPSEVVVGQIAKETAVIEPGNTSSLVKTLMGKSDFAINYNGEDISPEEVSAYILKKLAKDASDAVDQEVKDVVITVPAYFGNAHRVATENAGRIAGLNVLEIINEPTAAALYYGCTKDQGKKTILVYDLGGGTFDVTIMDIDDGKIKVICSDGLHELGGKDWDEALMRYLHSEFVTATDSDGSLDEYAQQALRLKAEKAKQQLSSSPKTTVMMDAAGLAARIEVTREKFDELTSALLNETMDKTDAAIAIAKDMGYEVTEILLVGGSTRMKQVEEALTQRYGMAPKKTDNADEAVARGAAIHALDVARGVVEPQSGSDGGGSDTVSLGGTAGPTFDDEGKDLPPSITGAKGITVIHATTKSYALRVLVSGEPKCNNLIIKNNELTDGLISITKTYGTAEDNMQTVELVVFENDFMDEYFEVDEQFILGKAVLPLSGNLPEGSPIEVSFTLNTQGLLRITGLDKTNGQFIEAEMQSPNIPSEQQIQAIENKVKDIIVM